MDIFRGGIPYAIDVRRLQEAFPTASLVEGLLVTHSELEGVLDCKRGTQRYYGVVNSWIKHERHSNGVFAVWEFAQGIRILDPSGVLDYAETRTRQKIKQTGGAIRTFAWVDRQRLNDTGQKRLDHQLRVAAAIAASLDTARQQLTIDLTPVKSLPGRRNILPPKPLTEES